MGRACCQHCGALTIDNKVKVETKRKRCLKFCKIILKHVATELVDHWVSDKGDTTMHHKKRKDQIDAQIEVEPRLCKTCKAKSKAEAEAEIVATALKREVEAAVATVIAVKKQVYDARAYHLMLIIKGILICMFISVCVRFL